MPFCPNCSADLKSSAPARCWNCDVLFVGKDGWRPTQAPTGPFREVKRAPAPMAATAPAVPERPMSRVEMVIRGVVGAPLLLVGLLLLWFATAAGAWAGVPGALFVAAALGVFSSRSAHGTMIADLFAGLLCVALFGALSLVVGAGFQR